MSNVSLEAVSLHSMAHNEEMLKSSQKAEITTLDELKQLAIKIIGYSSSNSSPTQSIDELSADKLRGLTIQIIKNHPLSNPFPTPVRLNPYAEQADQLTRAWMEDFNISSKKLRSANIIQLTAGAYPNCNLEQLIHNQKWILFLYGNDDVVERLDPTRVKALNDRKMSFVKDKTQPTEEDPPLNKAFHDLVILAQRMANKEWLERFFYRFDQHFESTVGEANNREKKIYIPDFESYRAERPHTGAPYIVLLLIELEANIPKAIFEKHLEEMTRLCNRIICDLNDIKSSPNEFKKKFINNLIFVIKRALNCSLEEAIQLSVTIHNQEVNRFEELKDELYVLLKSKECEIELKNYEPVIVKYVEGMRDWLASHFAFCDTSPRYN